MSDGIVDGQPANEASFRGFIFPYAGSATPAGFLPCDGSAVSRATYALLFAVIGTTYGVGDGSTTFNLPNLKGRVIVGYSASAPTYVADFATTDVDTATDIITVPSNLILKTGQPVVLTTTGTLPAGLSLATTYYVIRLSATTIYLATSVSNANTASGGNRINITSVGSGTHTLTATFTARPLGEVGGSELAAALAKHTHASNAEYEAGGSGSGGTSGGVDTAVTINESGEDSPSNMQPYLVVNYMIKT